MKAFHFRLEAVLTLRQQAEQAAQQRCAKAQRAVQEAVAQLEAAQTAIGVAEGQRLARLQQGCSATQLEQLHGYELVLRERRVARERDLAAAREQAEKARQQLLLATQEREALEHLRTRQRRAYAYEAARNEQKALDEMSARTSALTASWQQEVEAI